MRIERSDAGQSQSERIQSELIQSEPIQSGRNEPEQIELERNEPEQIAPERIQSERGEPGPGEPKRIKSERIEPLLNGLQAEPEEAALVAGLLETALLLADKAGAAFGDGQEPALASHLLATVRRGERGESLPEVGAETMEQVSPLARQLARETLEPLAVERGYAWNDTELLLLAVHFDAAMEP